MDKKMKYASGLLGSDEGEQVEELNLSELKAFENHPFHVIEDENFTSLVESIAVQGVAMPIIVRPRGRGMFEIVSGHRRVKACEILGLETVPGFIRDLDDEEAVLFMVDTNIQREELLYSEKAFAYHMKMEALKRKAGRPKKNGVPVEHNSLENGVPVEHNLRTRELLAKNATDSAAQIQRYIRLTYLFPDLLTMVDKKKLAFQTGVELSYLTENQQKNLYEILRTLLVIPSLEQAKILRKQSQEGHFSEELVKTLLQPGEKKPVKLSMQADMGKYFPPNTSKKEMEQVILQLLERWKTENEEKL